MTIFGTSTLATVTPSGTVNVPRLGRGFRWSSLVEEIAKENEARMAKEAQRADES